MMNAPTGEARVRISEALGASIGARFVRVVALGGLLVGATVLYSSLKQGEAGSPPASSVAIQDFEVEALESPVIGVPAYLGSDAGVDFAVEELEAPVIGITSPVQAPAPEFRIDPEWERALLRPELIREYEEMGIPWAFDELGNVVEAPQQPGAGRPLSHEEMEAQIERDWCHQEVDPPDCP